MTWDKISKIVKFTIRFMGKKTNALWDLKYQNEYFDVFYKEVLKV